MNPREIDMTQEISMIFRIVMRNITLKGWENLLPEAQNRMLEEVATLIRCEFISREDKQQLALRIHSLKNHVTANYRQRIISILAESELALGKAKTAA
ncbi:MAG: hypothetical protein RLP12_15660 [Ekhidna sp.]